MTEQLAMFDPTPYQVAPIEPFENQAAGQSATRRRTMKVETMIALGQHPMGGPCRPERGTCGDCLNLRRVEYHNNHYLKCSLTRWTHGTGTDIRRKWPACDRWVPVNPPQPIPEPPPEPDPLAPALDGGEGNGLSPTLSPRRADGT